MRCIKGRHSAWHVITLLIVVLALALTGCGNDNKPRRVALDADALPTLDRDALPYGQLIFHESAYPEHALDVLQAQRLETPVCLIVQESDVRVESGTAELFVIVPGIEGFTEDPLKAKTLLYASRSNWGVLDRVYNLYAVSAETGNVYACVGSDGHPLEKSLDSMGKVVVEEDDRTYCDWLIEKLPPDGTGASVNERLAALDSQVFRPENVNALARLAYDLLAGWDFDSAKGRLGEDVKSFLDAVGETDTVLAITRTRAPNMGDLDESYEYPDYEAWIAEAVLQYCVGNCDDPANVTAPQPHYAMVSENVGYHNMGNYSKVGTLYSYYTRYTLLDLQEGIVVAWTCTHSDPYDKTYTASNGMQVKNGTQYVIDQNYPIDENGRTVYEELTPEHWRSLLGVEVNHWNGRAILRDLSGVTWETWDGEIRIEYR